MAVQVDVESQLQRTRGR